MKPLTPYLFFDGNAKEAMTFYKECFGGKLEVMTYGAGPGDPCPDGSNPDPDKVMHACLSEGDFVMMASDNPYGKPVEGDTVSLNINCESREQIETLFKMLGEEGSVLQPLEDMFWGARFGMVIDKFGFRWMLNLPLEE